MGFGKSIKDALSNLGKGCVVVKIPAPLFTLTY